MKPIMLFAVLVLSLAACGPTQEELAAQTQQAATTTASNRIKMHPPTVILRPSETPTVTVSPTFAPTATLLPTYTPTETPYPILNIADEPQYPTGVSSEDPWSIQMFLFDTVSLIHLECSSARMQQLISPAPISCPFDNLTSDKGLAMLEHDHYYYLFCVYGENLNAYSVEYTETILRGILGERPTFYTRYDRRYSYQEYQELIFLRDCRDIIADWEAAHGE